MHRAPARTLRTAQASDASSALVADAAECRLCEPPEVRERTNRRCCSGRRGMGCFLPCLEQCHIGPASVAAQPHQVVPTLWGSSGFRRGFGLSWAETKGAGEDEAVSPDPCCRPAEWCRRHYTTHGSALRLDRWCAQQPLARCGLSEALLSPLPRSGPSLRPGSGTTHVD